MINVIKCYDPNYIEMGVKLNCYLSQISEKTIVGAMIVGAMIVGAMSNDCRSNDCRSNDRRSNDRRNNEAVPFEHPSPRDSQLSDPPLNFNSAQNCESGTCRTNIAFIAINMLPIHF